MCSFESWNLVWFAWGVTPDYLCASFSRISLVTKICSAARVFHKERGIGSRQNVRPYSVTYSSVNSAVLTSTTVSSLTLDKMSLGGVSIVDAVRQQWTEERSVYYNSVALGFTDRQVGVPNVYMRIQFAWTCKSAQTCKRANVKFKRNWIMGKLGRFFFPYCSIRVIYMVLKN